MNKAEAYEENKNNILAGLRKAGIKKCRVVYEGSGDSGQIEEISYDGLYRTHQDATVPQWGTSRVITDSSFGTTKVAAELREVGLASAIEALCWTKLERYGGWEDNIGAQGSFVIDVEGGTINWRHETNIMEVEVDEEEF
jgi:hypothetical protein